MSNKSALLLLFTNLILLTTAFNNTDLVDLANLPNLNVFASNYTAQIFSGYLNASNQQYLHYMLFTSLNDPETDPLILWLNGGPGCSSLIGTFTENGPFILEEGSSDFIYNNNTWNTNANVLYLESPAGIGFSIYNTTQNISNATFDDLGTTIANINSLISFYQKYPSLQDNPFYIAGESYAGIYVPYLTLAILEYIQNGSAALLPTNFVGIIMINAVTHHPSDVSYGRPIFNYGHGFIPPQDFINYTSNGCLANETMTPICSQLYSTFEKFYGAPIDAYNVFGYCYTPALNFSNDTKTTNFPVPGPSNSACDSSGPITNWLNEQAVQDALNVGQYNITWYSCNSITYNEDPRKSYWTYPTMIQAGLQILWMSGDADSVVPTVGTLKWITMLNAAYGFQTLNPMQPWTLPGNNANETQIAGYWAQYESLTFVQVKGAGHQVPQYNRPGAWKVLYSFLNGTELY